jgi:hypothetical protein
MEKNMSGEIAGQAIGYGIGQEVKYPSPSEAMEAVSNALDGVEGALAKARNAGDPEVFAFRAHVLAERASALAQAAYVLQRAAYTQATNPQAVENLPSGPSRAE